MNAIGQKVCRRCTKEKPEAEFFNDDRGNWCMVCNYDFLRANADDPEYADAREFTHPNLRNFSRSPEWVLTRLRTGIESVLGLKLEGTQRTPEEAASARMADATRLPGQRAWLCEVCKEKFGGESVFKAHRKYGNKPGRPSRDAVLTCYSLVDSRFTKDENEVWRGATPIFEYPGNKLPKI